MMIAKWAKVGTWGCRLVGDCSLCTLRDCGVTDSHHGHELLDDSSRGLQEVVDRGGRGRGRMRGRETENTLTANWKHAK